MRKTKLFALTTMAALATMMPQTMTATAEMTADVLFSLTTTGSFGDAGTEVDDETPYTKGTANYYLSSGSAFTAGATEGDPWTVKGNGQYIKVVLSRPVKAGDVLVINGSTTDKKNGDFRLFDNNTGSSSADVNGLSFTVSGSTVKDYSGTVAANSVLVGKNTFYLRWSSGSNTATVNYIKFLSGTPSVVTATKKWDFKNTYDTPSTATTFGMTNDGMYYSAGINFGQETDFSSIGNLLNIQSSGNSDATLSASSKYLMFYVPAGTVQVKVNAIPYGNSNKTLYCKVGSQDAEGKDAKGKDAVTELSFTAKTTTDVTPVYLYVKGPGSLYYIQDVTATITPASGPTITINTIDYATYSSRQALDFSAVTTMKAYIVTGESSGTLTYQQVTKVPAETGLLLVGTAGATATPAILSDAADDVSANLLKPTTTSMTVAESEAAKIFVLGNKNSVPGFYKSNSGRELTVGKAYLYLESGISAGREFFAFNFDDETTGIGNAVNSEERKVKSYYDLQGRRVAQPVKGLYIVNGRKVVIN